MKTISSRMGLALASALACGTGALAFSAAAQTATTAPAASPSSSTAQSPTRPNSAATTANARGGAYSPQVQYAGWTGAPCVVRRDNAAAGAAVGASGTGDCPPGYVLVPAPAYYRLYPPPVVFGPGWYRPWPVAWAYAPRPYWAYGPYWGPAWRWRPGPFYHW